MGEIRAYLALVAYPAIVVFVFDWNSAGSKWARKNRSFFMPPDLKANEERKGRCLIILRYGLLLFILRGLAGSRFWQIVLFGGHSYSWSVYVAAGIAWGVLMLGCRRLISLFSTGAASAEKNEYLLHGATVLWLTIFLTGGLVEEFWRAFCIKALEQNGQSEILSNFLASFAFSIAHLSGLPSRIAPGVASVCAEIIMGLMLGAIFIWSSNLIAPCVASTVYYTSSFFLARWRVAQAPTSLNSTP